MTNIPPSADKPNLTPMRFDVESGIAYYLPSLLKLIKGKFSWSNLDRQWNKRINDEMFAANGQSVKRIMTLLTLTTNAYKNHGFFETELLRFIDHTLKVLIEKMSAQELELIKGNLYDLLVFSDSFLDHLGEILVLADFKLNHPYKLLKCEEKLSKKGVPIDFMFLDTTTGKNIFVEVFCIKLTERNFCLSTKYSLGEFINKKLEKKKIEKDKSGLEYTLFPVLWLMNSDEKDYMHDLASYFRENTFEMYNVATPHLILMGQNSDNKPITQFVPVSVFSELRYKHF